ncbi:MAG: metallophosphoesterase [Bacteroidales bacterium]|nr:metallophosphoesterase [Bacteroidales bacterium]
MPYFIILFAIFFFGGQFYAYYRLWHIIPCVWLRWAVLIIAIVAAVFFLVSMFFADSLPIRATSTLYKVGTGWFFILLELIVLFLVVDLLRLLPFLHISNLLNNSWIGFVGVVALIGGMMVYGNINYRTPQRTEIIVADGGSTATSDHHCGLDKQFTEEQPLSDRNCGYNKQSPLKIVFASDLHIGYSIGANEIAKWVSLINKENPDIIIFGGDIIDNSTRPLFADSTIASLFRSLKARYGVYGILGNHEYISQRGRTLKNSTDPTYKEVQEAAATATAPDADIADSKLSVKENYTNQGGKLPEVERFYREAGIMLLRDTVVNIAGQLLLIGRDDYSNLQRNTLEKVLTVIPDSIRSNLPTILLDHQPRNLNQTAANGITLQLSGHTHAGQLIPINWITKLIYENDYGLLKKDSTTIYVTSGLGIWGGKFRIGTKSEYVVINLTK